MKRTLDFVCSLLGLVVFSPILFPIALLVFLRDGCSPIYVSQRVGINGKIFLMIKLRSMVKNAHLSGVDSTKSDDPRITSIGRFIRKYKLDELAQLWNVLAGDMSLVGPRPNVEAEVKLYTEAEKRLLSVKPGITDIASIVFADEGEILRGSEDPDVAYNQLIRPGKSMLGLFYIERQSILLDLRIILLTLTSVASREKALNILVRMMADLNAPVELLKIASRRNALVPSAPPGSDKVVVSRKTV